MRFQKNVFSHCCFALDMQDKTDYYAFGVELKGRNWKKTTDAKVTIIESIGTSGGSDPRIGE